MQNRNRIFTNSEGWKVIPPREKNSLEPCVTCPNMSTAPMAVIPAPA